MRPSALEPPATRVRRCCSSAPLFTNQLSSLGCSQRRRQLTLRSIMSDTASEESQNSVEGGAPPSTDTSSSWPLTEIAKSEGGGAHSASASQAASSLLSSPELDYAVSSAEDQPSALRVPSDLATEYPGAGAALHSDTSPPPVAGSKSSATSSSSHEPVTQGDATPPVVIEQHTAEGNDSSDAASVPGSQRPGKASASSLTPKSATGDGLQPCAPVEPAQATTRSKDQDSVSFWSRVVRTAP